MNLLVTCCNFRNTPIEIREKFAFVRDRGKKFLGNDQLLRTCGTNNNICVNENIRKEFPWIYFAIATFS